MSWLHVEDCEGATNTPAFSVDRKDTFTSIPYRAQSTSTNGHSIWRCGNCRALACTKLGEAMSGKCGVCKE